MENNQQTNEKTNDNKNKNKIILISLIVAIVLLLGLGGTFIGLYASNVNQVKSLNETTNTLKEELKTEQETFSVIYTSFSKDKVLYTEKVKKGEDVKNIPSIPNTAEYIKDGYTCSWSGDGKNIQQDTAIYPVFTENETVKVTFEIVNSLGNSYPSIRFIEDKELGNALTKTFDIKKGSKLYFQNGFSHNHNQNSSSTDLTVKPEFHVIYENKIIVTLLPISYEGGSYDDYPDVKWEYTKEGSTDFQEITGEYIFISEAATIRTGNYQFEETCLPKGTKIDLSNGSTKNVEDLRPGDSILAYNKFTGKIEPTEFFFNEEFLNVKKNLITLNLENGKSITIVDHENVFDMDERKFIPVKSSTYKEIVGKNIMVNNNGEIASSKVISSFKETKVVDCYSTYSYKNINYVSNGIVLKFQNTFDNLVYEIKEDYKVDMDSLNNLIATYGQYTYDDFKDYFNESLFDGFDYKTAKILVGLGYSTYEDMVKEAIECQRLYDNYLNRIGY